MFEHGRRAVCGCGEPIIWIRLLPRTGKDSNRVVACERHPAGDLAIATSTRDGGVYAHQLSTTAQHRYNGPRYLNHLVFCRGVRSEQTVRDGADAADGGAPAP